MKDRGLALLSTVLLLGAVTVLVAALFFSAYLEVRAARNEASRAAALHSASAGIEWLIAEAGREAGFGRLVSRATAGGAPFSSPYTLPGGSTRYQLSLRAGPAGGIIGISEGFAADGGRATVEGYLVREQTFLPPSVSSLGGALTTVALAGGVSVHSPPDVAAIGAEGEGVAALWDAGSGSGPRAVVVGNTGFAESSLSLASNPDRVLQGPIGNVVWGSHGSPELVHLTGNADVSGTATVRGILVADAPLRVSGVLRVEGMLLAMAGLDIRGVVEVTGALHVDGMLASTVGSQLTLAGTRAAFDLADRARPGELPKRCVLGGWRELW